MGTEGALDTEVEGEQDTANPGESQEKTIPESRLIAALANQSKQLTAQFDAKYEALRREFAEKAKPQQELSRGQLLQLVEDGKITMEVADAEWARQLTAQVEAKVLAKVETASTTTERQRKVNAELAGYREVVSQAWVEGTPERAKVEREFAHLVELGHPHSKETEAAALRAAFGDIATLKASKAKAGPADTHSETGGGRPPQAKSGPLKGLTPRQREHYEEGIKKGRYADWKAVEAELAFARK